MKLARAGGLTIRTDIVRQIPTDTYLYDWFLDIRKMLLNLSRIIIHTLYICDGKL